MDAVHLDLIEYGFRLTIWLASLLLPSTRLSFLSFRADSIIAWVIGCSSGTEVPLIQRAQLLETWVHNMLVGLQDI